MSKEKCNNFEVNEKLLCLTGTVLCDAKCVDIKKADDSETLKYKIHFVGKNKNHDEWVQEGRMYKTTPANLKLKEDLEKQYLGKLKKRKQPKPGRPEKPNVSKSTDGSKTRKITTTVETKEEYLAKITFNIEMPRSLNTVIADDWDLVTRQRRLFKVPATVTVLNILETYRAKKCAEGIENEKTLREFSSGIQHYFDKLLGSQLLYPVERPQLAEVMQKNSGKTPSQIYGVLHLLRLFIRLGSVLAYTDLSEEGATRLLAHIHDFLHYLQENIAILLSNNDYSTPT